MIDHNENFTSLDSIENSRISAQCLWSKDPLKRTWSERLTSQRNCAEFESSCQNKKNWKCLNFLIIIIIIIIIYFLYIKQSIYGKGHKVEFSEIASN